MITDILPPDRNDSSDMPVGLDFGTTNTVLSYYASNIRRNGPFICQLPTMEMNRFPSMVYQENENTLLAGTAAYANRLIYPERVAQSTKKNIGDASFRYDLGGIKYSPVQIASEIIKGIFREVISTDLEFCPTVITATVPYHFKNIQNTNTLEAINAALENIYTGQDGTLRSIKLIPEPIAAAIFYIYQNRHKIISNNTLLTYDIGGGTLDLTLIRYSINRSLVRFEILASEGMDNFGGNDFDELIHNYIIDSNDIDLSVFTEKENTLFNVRVKDEIINAKHRLSQSNQTQLIVANLPHIGHLNCRLSRSDFEKLLSGQLNSQRNMLQEFRDQLSSLLKKAGVDAENVETLLPIGGASQVPVFLSVAKRVLFNAQTILMDNDGYFSYVSKGAAIYSAMMSDKLQNTNYTPFGESVKYIDIASKIPHSILLEKYNGLLEVIIPENSPCPYVTGIRFIPTAIDDKTGCVTLNEVKVFQGKQKDKLSQEGCQFIGCIDFSDKRIYVHQRKLADIIIEMNVYANETLVSFSVKVNGGNKDKSDLIFDKRLTLMSNA